MKKYCDQIGSEGIFGACLQRYIIRLPANHCFPNMLNFSHNNLTKMIPKEIGHLKSLATLNSAPTCYQERFHHITPQADEPKLCGIVVDRPCSSAEAHHVTTLSREQTDRRMAITIAFGAFFGVGVLYDQMVLSKYFGQSSPVQYFFLFLGPYSALSQAQQHLQWRSFALYTCKPYVSLQLEKIVCFAGDSMQ